MTEKRADKQQTFDDGFQLASRAIANAITDSGLLNKETKVHVLRLIADQFEVLGRTAE